MKESILKKKSKAFALRIIKMYKFLCDEKKEYVLSKQVLRSGTSIGANISEAFYAQSDADFIAKLYISRKEAGETIYWVELLCESSFFRFQCGDFNFRRLRGVDATSNLINQNYEREKIS